MTAISRSTEAAKPPVHISLKPHPIFNPTIETEHQDITDDRVVAYLEGVHCYCLNPTIARKIAETDVKMRERLRRLVKEGRIHSKAGDKGRGALFCSLKFAGVTE